MYFGFEIRLIYAFTMQTIRSVFYLELKKCYLYFTVKNFFKYIIIRILYDFLYFPFRTLTLYTILCPSDNFPCKIFTVYCNKHNQSSLSLTTLTPFAILPTHIQLYYLQQV